MKKNFKQIILIISFLPLFNLGYSQTLSLTDSLIAYYPFSGNANDAAGNGNNGTVHGAQLTTDRFGNANSAYLFTAANGDYIDYIPGSKFHPTTYPMTITAWVKCNSTSQGNVFLNDYVPGSAVTSGLFFNVSNVYSPNGVDGSICDGTGNSPSSRRSIFGSENANDNKWHFVAVVYYGVTNMKVYVDCNYDNSAVYSGTGGPLAYVGNHGSSGLNYNGVMDEIRFYHRALTQSDLEAIYAFPKPYLSVNLGTDTTLGCSQGASITLNPAITGNPLTYKWSTNSNASSISVNSQGAYSLSVTGNFGCSASDTINVKAASIPVVVINGKTVICANGDGTTLTASGANTYTWSAGNGLGTTTGASIVVNPTVAATYSVVGTTLGGCTGLATTIVTVDPLPTVTVNSISICNGSKGTLTASGTATSFTWSPSSGLSATTGASLSANPTITTTYSVTGTNNCGSTNTIVVVTVNQLPTLSVNPLTICNGSSGILTASGTSTSYTWAPSTGLNATTGTSVTANPAINTTYTVTGAGSCGSTAVTVAVTVTPVYTSSFTVPASICGSGTPAIITYIGNATLGATYNWNFNGGAGGVAGAGPQSITWQSAGTYVVTLSLGSGACTSPVTSHTVVIKDIPSSSFTVTSPVCENVASTLTYTGIPVTGATYTWNFNGATGGIAGATNQALVWASAGTYTPTLTVSANGCTSSLTSAIVTVNQLPTISVNPLTICNGSGGTLTVLGTSTSYTWSPSAGLSATTGASVTAHPTTTSTYTVTGNGSCGSTSATTVVTVNPLPTVNVSPISICNGSQGTLTATGASTSFTWSPSMGLSATTGVSVAANPTTNTTYTVTGSNSCGSVSTSVVVTVNPLPTVSVNPLAICNGLSGSLTASGNASSYTWAPLSGLSATTGKSVTANPTANTTYTVTGTNNCGSTSATVVVTVNPNPVVLCSSDASAKTVSVSATGGSGTYTYLWNTSPAQTTQTATITSSGTYTVVVTDANTCSATCASAISISSTSTCDGTWRTESQQDWGATPCGTKTKCGNGYRYSCDGFYHRGNNDRDNNNGRGKDNDNNYGRDNDDHGRGYDDDGYGHGNDNNGDCNVGNYLYDNFASAFPSPNYLTVGCTSGNKLELTSYQAVADFLPSSGTSKALPKGKLVNPGRSYSNEFAGQVVALTLSITFDLIDPDFGSSSTHLQDLVVKSGIFAGWTVKQVLAEANNKIGGCSCSRYSICQLDDAIARINNNFDNKSCNNHYLTCPGTSDARMEFDNTPETGADNINGIEALAYPNPFTAASTIEFRKTGDNAHVLVEVFTITGSKVSTLFDADVDAGTVYKVPFNAGNLASGMYIYRITSGSDVINGKLSLLGK